MTTFYKAITSVDGNIELSTVMGTSGEWIPPSLAWFVEDKGLRNKRDSYFWDNDEYIEKLFKSIKRRKKNQQTRELKKFCLDHNIDFKETKKILLKIYKQSKKQKFWKHGKNS